MKVVVNNPWSGHSGIEWSDRLMAHNPKFDFENDMRTNPILVEAIEKSIAKAEDVYGDISGLNTSFLSLAVIEIPNEATDWEIITDCDSEEHVIAVINGRLVHIYPWSKYEHP